jgi:hypothetical protein
MTLRLASGMSSAELPPLKKEGWGGFALAINSKIKSKSPLTPLFQRGEQQKPVAMGEQRMPDKTDA